jgi:hypothetical protein
MKFLSSVILVLLVSLTINTLDNFHKKLPLIEQLKGIHDPLIAHDKIVLHSKEDLRNIEGLFKEARKDLNNTAMMHIANSHNFLRMRSCNTIHPAQCTAHLTLPNIMSLLLITDTTYTKINLFGKNPLDLLSLRKDAYRIIKNSMLENNKFAELSYILIKNATVGKKELSFGELYYHMSELLVKKRYKPFCTIPKELKEIIKIFSTFLKVPKKNKEILIAYILFNFCTRSPKLTDYDAFHSASIIKYISQASNIPELNFWVARHLFISGAHNHLITESAYYFNESGFYDQNILLDQYENIIAIPKASQIDQEYFSYLFDFDLDKIYREIRGNNIEIDVIQPQESDSPILTLYHNGKSLVSFKPKMFESHNGKTGFGITVTKFKHAEQIPTATLETLIAFYTSTFSKNPSKEFDTSALWYYKDLVTIIKKHHEHLQNTKGTILSKISRQSSLPIPERLTPLSKTKPQSTSLQDFASILDELQKANESQFNI